MSTQEKVIYLEATLEKGRHEFLNLNGKVSEFEFQAARWVSLHGCKIELGGS